ncbi:MAG: 3-isopropylmalate dehydratase small subunit [Acidimicrobiia bacterium]
MRAVSTVRGTAIPLDRAHVDTDQIIPAKYLKRIERTGYGKYAFETWREDPDFVLNRREHAGATIMITRENFGSGSSREHAVWALDDLGLEALVGVDFADIFKNNCFQGGLLTIELGVEDIDYLMELVTESPATELVVDLPEQRVEVPMTGWKRAFDIDPFRKYRLMRGLDDISMTLEYVEDIESHETKRHSWMPETTQLSL